MIDPVPYEEQKSSAPDIDMPQSPSCKYDPSMFADLKNEIGYLRDLFIRRLNDDKQKTEMIKKLEAGANFAFVEPFLYDIILVLDRLEKSQDDFCKSVSEELYEILHRRGVERIDVQETFNPALYKAVRVTTDVKVDMIRVVGVVRQGYTFSGKVIRPAEVVVAKPRPDGTVVAAAIDMYRNYDYVTDVTGWSDIVSIYASYELSAGLKTDGSIITIGSSNGFSRYWDTTLISDWKQLLACGGHANVVGLNPDGTIVQAVSSDNNFYFTQVSDWTDIVYISMGLHVITGVKSDGTILVSGTNK